MLIDKGIEVDATRGVGRDEGLGEKVQERAQPDPRQAVPPPSPTQPQPAPRLLCTFGNLHIFPSCTFAICTQFTFNHDRCFPFLHYFWHSTCFSHRNSQFLETYCQGVLSNIYHYLIYEQYSNISQHITKDSWHVVCTYLKAWVFEKISVIQIRYLNSVSLRTLMCKKQTFYHWFSLIMLGKGFARKQTTKPLPGNGNSNQHKSKQRNFLAAQYRLIVSDIDSGL